MSTTTDQESCFKPDRPTEVYPVKGIPVKEGDHPGVRQEVRDLKKDADLWNLYLLGLWQFQLVPTDNMFSYYRIAGIHGLPYEAWPAHNEEIKKKKVVTKDNEPVGFCTHTSILFLPWHRPFLALFESVLQQAVLYVAEQYTEAEGKHRYLAAAKKFRMPYWDWARQDLSRFPEEAADHEASVIMPNNLYERYKEEAGKYKKQKDGTVTMANPLFSWKFPDDINKDIRTLELHSENHSVDGTTRWYGGGADGGKLTAKQQADQLAKVLTPFYKDRTLAETVKRRTANLGERLNILLKGYTTFAGVSYNEWAPKEEQKQDGNAFGSFEDIHNSIHNLVGGSGDRTGQMAQVAQSAFDPIFWLHHANIDRVLAIWQVLHDEKQPNKWVTQREATGSTWGTAAGSTEGLDTDLLPFYKDDRKFYTSNDVRDTEAFGYVYPETQPWLSKGGVAGYKRDIKIKLDALYLLGSLPSLVAASRKGDFTGENKLRERARDLKTITAAEPENTFSTSVAIAVKVAKKEKPSIKIAPQIELAASEIKMPHIDPLPERSLVDLIKGDTYLEWLVNVKAPKHARGGSYEVHIFLGPVVEEECTSQYVLSPYEVGTLVPLGQSEDTQCEKCKKDQAKGVFITGQIPLTIALVERYLGGDLESLEKDHVVPYLQKTLHWEVIDEKGERRTGERSIIPGLRVGVASNEVTLPRAEGDLPVYAENNTVYPEITTKADGSGGRGEGTGITRDFL